MNQCDAAGADKDRFPGPGHVSPTRGTSERWRYEILDSVSALEKALPAWLALLASGVSGYSIHNDPRLIMVRLGVDPGIRLRVVLVWRGEKLLAVAPFYLRDWDFIIQVSIWKLRMGRARVLRLFGEEVICRRDFELAPVVGAISEFLRDLRNDFDYVEVRALNPESAFWKAALNSRVELVPSNFRKFVMRDDLNHRVALAPSFEEFLTQFGKKTRKSLRQSIRRLDDLGAEVEIFTALEQVPELLDCMQGVYANAWQAKALDVADVGTDRRMYIEGIARLGWLRSYVLKVDGRAVAFDHGYLHNGTLHSMEGAYRLDWARWSPGSVLSLKLIDDLHGLGNVKEIDFGPGDLPYKRVIGNVTIPIRAVCFAHSARWRIALRCQLWVNWLYNRTRGTFVKIGIADWLRRILKRKQEAV